MKERVSPWQLPLYFLLCVCYSKLLSQRDYKSFEILFESFKVNDKISYSTIKELCETNLNQDGNIREALKMFYYNENYESNCNSKKEKSVLLIDEVDVFFGENFLGETYNPQLLLNKKEYQELTEYVLSQPIRNLSDVKNTELYQQAKLIFPKNLTYQLDTEIMKMINQKKDFETHKYELTSEGKIAYKEFGELSSKKTFGYKTQLAYIKEWKLGNVTETIKNENTGIIVFAGKYSYAEILKNFELMMGVTGTLKTLSKSQTKILDSYNIKKRTYTPSLFGERKFIFREINDFCLTQTEEEIHRKLSEVSEKILKMGRSVIIFFDNEEGINKYRNSGHCTYEKNYLQELTAITNDKDVVVRKAVKSKMLTLAIKDFGRGIDFICTDEKVIKKGGVHVIQTFFSTEEGEEIQIMGRTARLENFFFFFAPF